MVNRYVKTKFIIDCFHTAFRFKYDKDFIFKGERHDFWEMTLLRSGMLTFIQDERVYHLNAGEIILHAPMVFHREMSRDGTSPEGFTLSFHTEGELPENLSCGVFKLDEDEIEEFSLLIDPLIEYVNLGTGDDFEAQLLRDKLSSFLIKISKGKTSAPILRSQSEIDYNRLVSVMREHVSENLTLNDFSRLTGISVSYMKLLFGKFAGISPKSYFSSLRASESARLLDTGMHIFEVSEKLDFSSQNYFSIFFKKHYGISPREYAAAQRSTSLDKT